MKLFIKFNVEKSLGLKNEIKWISFFVITFYHLLGIVWCYAYAFPVKIQTVLFAIVMFIVSGFGVAGGVHRLWSHKSFKARLPLQIFLMMCYSCAGQNSIYQWVKDHRLHHKFSDTDADPHNSKRGFFFSHIGWLMVQKNNQVLDNGKKIDMSDIEADPLLMIQHKYRLYFNMIFCHVIPLLISTIVLKEEWRCAVAWQSFIRFLNVLHVQFSVNSLAHSIGDKPYNKHISPVENTFVNVYSLGDGNHNYHHVFPYDYKAAEFCGAFNVATMFINCFEKIGWAYDLREPSPEMIKAVVARLNNGDNYKLDNDTN